MAIEKGQTFTKEEKVDKYRAVYYAGASGDFNPIHIDPEFGKMVGLGGTILHGLCTMAFTVNAITDWAKDPGKIKKIKCRFASPVHMEDVLSINGEVIGIEDGNAIVEMKVTTQTGTEVLTKVQAEVEM